MQTLISLNGRLTEGRRGRIAALTQHAFYGRGVWTTLAVSDAHPFLWNQHWARLVDHARRAGVSLSEWSEAQVKNALLEVISANRVEAGRGRVMFLAREGFINDVQRAPSVWRLPTRDAVKQGEVLDKSAATVGKADGATQTMDKPLSDVSSSSDKASSVIAAGTSPDARDTDLIIALAAKRAKTDAPLAVTVSPFRTNTLSPLVNLKTTNYLEHILAWQEARGRDFDEAVKLNERGEVTGATLANLFWVIDATLYTPALSTGALAGTTRAFVLQLAEQLSIPHLEVAHDLAHLSEADELFLTSAGRLIAPVETYDFHRFAVKAGNVTARLQEALRQAM